MKNILVIRLGAIGDVILTSPAILNLKQSFPESKISLLTRRHIAGLADYISGVDEILGFPEKASFRDLFLMGEYLDKLNFDMIVDLHGNLRSKYLMKHVSASVKVQYDKRRWERFAAVKWNKINPDPPHTIDLYNSAVKKCGGHVYADRPILRFNKKSDKILEFNNTDPTIAIAPGASYLTKQWPIEKFKNTAIECFRQISANIVLLLTQKDIEMKSVWESIPEEKLEIFVNTDLENLPEIISECDLLLSNDSGLAHIGSAVGIPVAALFGPTHPTLGFAPRGLNDIVIQTDQYCRPCSLHGKRSCYRDQLYCFEDISVDNVLEVISKAISYKQNSARAIFIDRDGTLIKDKDYISNPDDVEPEEKSIEAVRLANEMGYKVIVVSNQSGVARGYFDDYSVGEVNRKVFDIFHRAGALIDDILYCPHHRNGKVKEYALDCRCRKPAPGMVENACRRFNIDPYQSFVVGDKLSDVHLAYVTGGRGILVRTGYGAEDEKDLEYTNLPQPENIADNLFEAVNYIKEALGK